MGFGGISPWSLLIILLIVVLLFGTKKLKNVGGDLGDAIRSFKRSMGEGEKSEEGEREQVEQKDDEGETGRVFEAEGRAKDAEKH